MRTGPVPAIYSIRHLAACLGRPPRLARTAAALNPGRARLGRRGSKRCAARTMLLSDAPAHLVTCCPAVQRRRTLDYARTWSYAPTYFPSLFRFLVLVLVSVIVILGAPAASSPHTALSFRIRAPILSLKSVLPPPSAYSYTRLFGTVTTPLRSAYPASSHRCSVVRGHDFDTTRYLLSFCRTARYHPFRWDIGLELYIIIIEPPIRKNQYSVGQSSTYALGPQTYSIVFGGGSNRAEALD